MKFKYLKHTADVKCRAYGESLNECFENAVGAMFHSMYPNKINRKIKKTVSVEGTDLENLLYNFLEELLILMDGEGFFVSRIKVKINEKELSLVAEVEGDSVSNYNISLQVKAVTYNEMIVKRVKGVFMCQVVLDV